MGAPFSAQSADLHTLWGVKTQGKKMRDLMRGFRLSGPGGGGGAAGGGSGGGGGQRWGGSGGGGAAGGGAAGGGGYPGPTGPLWRHAVPIGLS